MGANSILLLLSTTTDQPDAGYSQEPKTAQSRPNVQFQPGRRRCNGLIDHQTLLAHREIKLGESWDFDQRLRGYVQCQQMYRHEWKVVYTTPERKLTEHLVHDDTRLKLQFYHGAFELFYQVSVVQDREFPPAKPRKSDNVLGPPKRKPLVLEIYFLLVAPCDCVCSQEVDGVRTAGADVDSVAAAQQDLQLDQPAFCACSGGKGRDYGDDHVAMSHDVTDPHFILIFTTTYPIPGKRTCPSHPLVSGPSWDMESSPSRSSTFPHGAQYFDGHIQNGMGVFGVHFGDPCFLLGIPRPEESIAPNGYSFRMGDFRRPLWINPKFPYLLLLPCFNPFYGPLFSCLNVTQQNLPIEEITTVPLGVVNPRVQWGLEQMLIRWLHLESLLYLTLRTMMDLHGSRAAVGVYTFLSPICYRYTEWNASSPSSAVEIALRSHDAFLPLMAKITLIFILLDAHDHNDWRDRLQESTKLHWQWIDDLERSAVGDLSIDRLGGIIDLTLSKSHPDHHLPRHARTSFPAVERNSGQKQGEDIHAFMERCRLHNEKWAQRRGPGKKGARVLIWEEEDGGFFIRRACNCIDAVEWEDLVVRQDHCRHRRIQGLRGTIRPFCPTTAADRWDEFTPNQRVYDSFSNKWDLCTALAPNEEAEPDDPYKYDDADAFQFYPPTSPDNIIPSLPDVPGRELMEGETGERAAQVLERAYNLDREDLLEDADNLPGWQTQNTFPTISLRFGFDKPAITPSSIQQMQDKACAWAVGDETWDVPVNSALLTLLQHILEGGLKSFPADLCDLLSPDSDLELDWNVDVIIHNQRDKKLYEISLSDDERRRSSADHLQMG
ncbi:hypothetical protein C8R44DRAFT_733402 [Mycena epipterygia]|nr:hypothetical protein C8R44DRAFT_733402 [Mycena epipterygia]